jgi:hypothetical protein
MLKMKRTFLAALILVTAATVSWAGTITVNRGGGTSYNAAGLTGYATDGSLMDGMQVTACVGGGCTTGAWGTTGAGAGAASGTNWMLALSGDTFSSAWTLSNLSQNAVLTSLKISAREGKTVFDTFIDPEMSPDSARGGPATYTGDFPNATAQYTDPLSIGGTFYNDLYLTLSIDFAGGFRGNVSFTADTDNVPVDKPIDPSDVPEPATYAMLATGLAGLAFLRRR